MTTTTRRSATSRTTKSGTTKNRTAKSRTAKGRTTKSRSTKSRTGGSAPRSRSRAGQKKRAPSRTDLRAPKPTGRSSRSRKRKSLKVTELGERYAAFLTATFVGLTLFGLVMVLSASSVSSLHQYADSPFFQFKRQAAWAGIGAVAFIVASRIDYRVTQRLAGPLMLFCIGLLVLLLIPGVGITRNASTRWLGVGSFVVQPSELTKLAMIIFIADLLARRERRMDRPELTVRPVMFVVYLCSALIILQPKLGTPVILGAVALIMLFIAGANLKSMLAWAVTSVGAVVILALATGYQKSRIDGWLDPWQSPQGIGLQAVQAQVGIASGGLFGVGLGASRAKWGFLPFAHTDFIFAIVAEEVGLIGASALIGAFILIAWFGIKAALAAPDRFGLLLAAGITSWLLVQAFLNIGMVIGVLPITGEALPFVSAGGSSLVTNLAAAGLLIGISRRATEGPDRSSAKTATDRSRPTRTRSAKPRSTAKTRTTSKPRSTGSRTPAKPRSAGSRTPAKPRSAGSRTPAKPRSAGSRTPAKPRSTAKPRTPAKSRSTAKTRSTATRSRTSTAGRR